MHSTVMPPLVQEPMFDFRADLQFGILIQRMVSLIP